MLCLHLEHGECDSRAMLTLGAVETMAVAHMSPMCRYVNVEGSELRLGVYESSATLCVYLESDAVGATLEHNLWVKFRVALLTGRGQGQPEWKQSAICTKTWNNSVLQFPKVCCWLRFSAVCQALLLKLKGQLLCANADGQGPGAAGSEAERVLGPGLD